MITYFYQQLGPLTYPLLLCALVASIIIMERLAALSIITLSGRLQENGRQLLVSHAGENKAIRDEIAALWLQGRQRRMSAGIRLLHIIALLSPLLGLLGTVVGLIDAFNSIGQHSGPIEPALLAGGLGVAMKTTAAGLIIAVPTLLFAHLFQLWVEKLTYATEKVMNMHSLQTEGVCTRALI
ncbi:MotA/TolQ/ExbB proton channel family protein [Microbulbifer sp. 2201CG32-9]|uniref:MotA/TolQ/ExbB proton channel family protein n=1 Tax=Microbulbifer sp. 2201CG32-9 TaxID=3232309 RepID=UPI00345B6C38